MIVLLYKVGRNYNAAYRTCEFFGVEKLLTYECTGHLGGNLFKAKNRVKIEEIDAIPKHDGVIYLETNGKTDIQNVDWSGIDTICIGGETHDFTSKAFRHIEKVKIPGFGKVSGLTVEAALAIALHSWRTYGNN